MRILEKRAARRAATLLAAAAAAALVPVPEPAAAAAPLVPVPEPFLDPAVLVPVFSDAVAPTAAVPIVVYDVASQSPPPLRRIHPFFLDPLPPQPSIIPVSVNGVAPSDFPDSVGPSPAAVPASGQVLYFATVRTPGKVVQFIVPPLLGSPANQILTSVNPRARMKLCKLPKISPALSSSETQTSPRLTSSETQTSPRLLDALTLHDLKNEIRLLVVGLGF